MQACCYTVKNDNEWFPSLAGNIAMSHWWNASWPGILPEFQDFLGQKNFMFNLVHPRIPGLWRGSLINIFNSVHSVLNYVALLERKAEQNSACFIPQKLNFEEYKKLGRERKKAKTVFLRFIVPERCSKIGSVAWDCFLYKSMLSRMASLGRFQDFKRFLPQNIGLDWTRFFFKLRPIKKSVNSNFSF